MLTEIINRIQFWIKVDRIGPDIPWTHWRLYFKSTMKALCTSKFREFGENSEFRPMAYAECCSKISIGKNIVIRPGCMIYADPTEGGGSIIIEDDVLIGNGVHFYTNNHVFKDVTIPIAEQGYTLSDGIKVRKGSWIGSNAVILPGVTIGLNSVVGAGSVVTRDVSDYTVVSGCPAKVIKSLK